MKSSCILILLVLLAGCGGGVISKNDESDRSSAMSDVTARQDGDTQAAPSPEPEVSSYPESSSAEILDLLACSKGEPWDLWPELITEEFNCNPGVGQEFVYFFNSSVAQDEWLHYVTTPHVLTGYVDDTPLAVGSGWAVRSTDYTRILRALDIGGEEW